VALGFFVKSLDQMAPGCMLTAVDLAKVQHIPLHNIATSSAAQSRVLHESHIAEAQRFVKRHF
jgi:hypothetical protein